MSLVRGVLLLAALTGAAPPAGEELLVTAAESGRRGGRLVTAQRSEPKTFNPVTAADGASREVIQRLTAELIRINRETQGTEPALAVSWTASADGRSFTLKLRHGVRFSDGHPFDADDVVFSFQVYLDEKVQSPQRDLLVVGGRPLAVRKIDAETVRVDLAEPYAAAERIFDGLAMLPRHLLSKEYAEGRISQAFGLAAPPEKMAGLGPFRLKEFVPGQRVVLERNPFYWKADRAGTRLPYLDELVFLSVPSDDAQALRFQAGETDVLSRLGADNYAALGREEAARGYQLRDLGAGLEYNVLVLNQSDPPAGDKGAGRRRAWFRDPRFRQAISSAIDRESLVRLAYRGRATPLWGHVTPGNRRWRDAAIPEPPRSLDKARTLLNSAGFRRSPDGSLADGEGQPVSFTILTSAGNAARTQIATLLQADLKELGIDAAVVPVEFRAFVDRIMTTRDFDACVMGIGGGDADPNSEINIWLSSGGMHLWRPGQKEPATRWEGEVDDLMRRQMTERDPARRKALYDKVQEIVARELPLVPLVSPNILVGAKNGLGGFRPAILPPYALWNADELYLKERP